MHLHNKFVVFFLDFRFYAVAILVACTSSSCCMTFPASGRDFIGLKIQGQSSKVKRGASEVAIFENLVVYQRNGMKNQLNPQAVYSIKEGQEPCATLMVPLFA